MIGITHFTQPEGLRYLAPLTEGEVFLALELPFQFQQLVRRERGASPATFGNPPCACCHGNVVFRHVVC